VLKGELVARASKKSSWRSASGGMDSGRSWVLLRERRRIWRAGEAFYDT
jgi:hypothetical protein